MLQVGILAYRHFPPGFRRPRGAWEDGRWLESFADAQDFQLPVMTLLPVFGSKK